MEVTKIAHYAFLDDNWVVTEVIVGIDETEQIEGVAPEQWYANFRGQRCVRTSYNGNIRKNYAGIGYTYDVDRDAFIPPKPYASWVLNEETAQWEAPVAYPEDAAEGEFYTWNEETTSWELVSVD